MIGNLPRETGLRLVKYVRRAVNTANNQINDKNKGDVMRYLKASLTKQLTIFSENFLDALSSDGIVGPMLISPDPKVRLQDNGCTTPKGWVFSPTYGSSTFKLPRPLIYKVSSGDTLWSICSNKGFGDIIVSELCAWNLIKESDKLKPGQKIWLFDRENLAVKDICRVYGENVNKDTVIDPGKLDPSIVQVCFQGNSFNYLATISAPCYDIVPIADVNISIVQWYCFALNVGYFECSINNAQVSMLEFFNPKSQPLAFQAPKMSPQFGNNIFNPVLPGPSISNQSGNPGYNWDRTLKNVSVGINTGGFLASSGEYSYVKNGMWKGNNNLWNDLSWGGNKWTGPRSAAICKAGRYRFISRGFFYVGAGISVVQGVIAYNAGDDAGVCKAGLDIAMGAIATFCGPVGWIFGGIYFLFDSFGVYEQVVISHPYTQPNYALPDKTYVAQPKFIP